MSCKVDIKILEQADRCPKKHVCQAEGGKPCCEIEETVNGSVFFTNCRSTDNCPYQYSFGSSFLCTCPVRQEIFKKHGC